MAAASVLAAQAAPAAGSILYVPKGPALDWSDAGLAAASWQNWKSGPAGAGAFVKIDPDVYYPGDAA